MHPVLGHPSVSVRSEPALVKHKQKQKILYTDNDACSLLVPLLGNYHTGQTAWQKLYKEKEKHFFHSYYFVKSCSWNTPISSGSGMESGSWAATSCFKVATLYPPGGTSPGIISGKWKTDLGSSTSFKDRCQSNDAMSTLVNEHNR